VLPSHGEYSSVHVHRVLVFSDSFVIFGTNHPDTSMY